MTSATQIRRAAHAVRAGGVLLHPTVGVWGLGCDPRNPEAIRRLVALKRRPIHKGLIVLAGQPSELDWLLRDPAQLTIQPPGTTLIVGCTAAAPAALTGGRETVAVRLSQHGLIRQLCAELGYGLVSSSANLSGRKAPARATQIHRSLIAGADARIGGQSAGSGRPSRIYDVANQRWVR